MEINFTTHKIITKPNISVYKRVGKSWKHVKSYTDMCSVRGYLIGEGISKTRINKFTKGIKVANRRIRQTSDKYDRSIEITV